MNQTQKAETVAELEHLSPLEVLLDRHYNPHRESESEVAKLQDHIAGMLETIEMLNDCASWLIRVNVIEHPACEACGGSQCGNYGFRVYILESRKNHPNSQWTERSRKVVNV